MANEVLEQAAAGLPEVKRRIAYAEELLAFMRSVGRSTGDAEQELIKMKAEANRWERELQSRGIPIPAE